MHSGKLLICLIIGVAVLAATVAWSHQASRGVRVLKLWGSDSAYLIRCAEEVILTVDGKQVDLSHAKGIAHARQALIADVSYDWEHAGPVVADPDWQFSLKFDDGERHFQLAFDFVQRVAASRDGTQVRLGPTLSNGLQVFFTEQFSSASPRREAAL